MQAAVRGQQTKCCPALIDIGVCSLFKASDVVTPKPESRQPERKPTAQTLRHRLERGCGVAAPVNGELLPACCGGTCEDERVVLAAFVSQLLKDGLVVKIAVVIVHPERVRAVVIDNICGNALAKVGLECIDAHFEQDA